MTCLMAIDEDCVRLVAGGMFDVGVHLLPAVNVFTSVQS